MTATRLERLSLQGMPTTRTRGIAKAVLTHMQDNADEMMTIDEVADDLDYDPQQVSQALSQWMVKMPARFERPSRGVYIYHSKGTDKPTMTVTVVHTTSKFMLVLDDDEQLWKLERMPV